MQFPSQLIEDAVNEIAKLPGIGKKTALRLVLHLLKQEVSSTEQLSEALLKMRKEIKYCSICFNISDHDVCSVCSSHKRDRSTICVVEDSRDVLAIENTSQYQGLYHVLGGVISPVEGIGPGDLKVEQLISRIEQNKGEVNEVIFALSPTMEGDTTAFYLVKKLKGHNIKLTTIARGIAIGGELEYTDEVTLGRSILSRTIYD